ncbi:MAG: hypothetical protein ISS70_09140 [Phycisphaerae bacterium]|nr:hypothetical protein [Phycisphaerae bacterium]
MKDLRTKLILMGLLALLPAYVYACSTPVFRYALERWPADFYDGVLVHRGPIAEGHPAAKLFEGETAEFLNLRLSRMDLDSAAEEDVKNLLGDKVPEKLPALVLWYPWQKGRAAPFWTGEFTPETVAVLIQSATREEVAKRLTEGQAGVWIFVESGDKAKDKAALELLKKELETVTKELMEFAPPVEEADTPGISFEFSTVSLSRTDPNERALLSIIMHSEPDLDEYVKEPMAVPVFGRGRALYTLIGEGINADNIREAAAFLTGPCGCEIKMMNPGVDLLMAVNWDGAVMQFYEEFYAAEEEELPELTSVFPDDPKPAQAELNVTAQTAESDSADDPPAEAAEEAEPLVVEDKSVMYQIDVNQAQVEVVETRGVRGLGVMGTAAVSLGGLMLAVVLGTLAVSRKNK